MDEPIGQFYDESPHNVPQLLHGVGMHLGPLTVRPNGRLRSPSGESWGEAPSVVSIYPRGGLGSDLSLSGGPLMGSSLTLV